MSERRTSGRKLIFISAALLTAAFVLVVCGAQSQAAPPASNTRVVTIQLDVDGDGHPTKIQVPVSDDPDSHGRVVALRRGQSAHWMVKPANLDITVQIGMKKDSPDPFDGPFRAAGPNVFSGKVRGDADTASAYLYWVKVHDNATGKDLLLDPEIRVDP